MQNHRLHRVSRRLLTGIGVLGTLALLIWPGCATPPLPSSRKPLSALRPADFSFKPDAPRFRRDILGQLGHPDEDHPQLGVVCYRLNQLTRRRLWLLFGVLPIAAPRDVDRLEIALLRFDQADQLQAVEVKIVTAYQPLRQAAQQWVDELDSKTGKR